MVKKWTKDDEQTLRDNYVLLGPRGVHSLLSQYSLEAIYKKAQKLGIQVSAPSSSDIKKNAKKRYDKWRTTDNGRITQRKAQIRYKYGSIEVYETAVAKRKAKDGFVYDSVEEAMVANIFQDAGVRYKKNEKKISFGDGTGFIPDFIINDNIYVEYFGRFGSSLNEKQYDKKVFKKLAFFKQNRQYRFVPLYPKDLREKKIISKIMEVLGDTASTIHIGEHTRAQINQGPSISNDGVQNRVNCWKPPKVISSQAQLDNEIEKVQRLESESNNNLSTSARHPIGMMI